VTARRAPGTGGHRPLGTGGRRPLVALPGRFAICRFPPDAPPPAWVFHEGASVWSITRTPDELSLVCDEDDLPPSVEPAPERWRAFRVQGVIPFGEIGVIAGITAPLAAAGISVFVVSTHDTDLVLVPADHAAGAARVWQHAGHELIG